MLCRNTVKKNCNILLGAFKISYCEHKFIYYLLKHQILGTSGNIVVILR